MYAQPEGSLPPIRCISIPIFRQHLFLKLLCPLLPVITSLVSFPYFLFSLIWSIRYILLLPTVFRSSDGYYTKWIIVTADKQTGLKTEKKLVKFYVLLYTDWKHRCWQSDQRGGNAKGRWGKDYMDNMIKKKIN